MSATDEPKGARGAGFDPSETANKPIKRHQFVESGTRFCAECRLPYNNTQVHFDEVGFDETPRTVESEKGRILANLLNTIGEQAQEIERLKRGDFTAEEFQNLCHNKTVQDGFDAFVTGCYQFQKQLFGVSADEVIDLVECLKNTVVDAAVEWRESGREGVSHSFFDNDDKLSAAIDALLAYRDVNQTPNVINYRALLLKYITFVGDEEGTNFITFKRDEFTDAEWSELERLSKESYAQA